MLHPAEESEEYRVFIGDVPVADLIPNVIDAGGVAFEERLFWREFPYFESARGDTPVRLESRNRETQSERWVLRLEFTVFVVPTKLQEHAYQAMVDDLVTLSRSLLNDLYGKSIRTYDVRFAKEHHSLHSREEELDSVEAALAHLGPLMSDIQKRPASRIKREFVQSNYWGERPLGPRECDRQARFGTRAASTVRPLRILKSRPVESFDIVEHRILKAFLRLLRTRAEACASAAAEHIRSIDLDRPFRDIRLAAGPSIYESVDLPRINRLREAMVRSIAARNIARSMERLPFLDTVPAKLLRPRGGTFQCSPEYRQLLHVMRGFLISHGLSYEGTDLTSVTKLTSRLFEQWCYLRIVESFRTSGLELQEWDEELRQSLQSRFIVDFDRGLQFEGQLSTNLRLRIRYEPWILGEQSAVVAGDTLCRVSHQNVAWSPDIVIECLRQVDRNWEPVYVLVLDCKYTAELRDHHWSDTRKYLQIRSTRSKRQVVRQIWLLSPGINEQIVSTDPAIVFGDNGPSCPSDEQVSFAMRVSSETSEFSGNNNTTLVDVFQTFASGTISFLRSQIL